MKVAILIVGLPTERIGGAEVQASKLAQLLAERHRVTVLTRSKEAPPELAESCAVHQRCRTRIPGVRTVADVFGTLALVARKDASIDVIIAYQTVIEGVLAAVCKALFGIPILVWIRAENEYLFERSWKTRLLSPFVLRRADSIAVQSSTVERELLEALDRTGRLALADAVRRKVVVIPNGISVPTDARSKGDVVLFVGRLVASKGVHHLIDAMRKCPDETLWIVGDGPERRRLERAAEASTNVRFLGRIPHDDLDGYYRRAKVLVLPSLGNEGLPNAIMEAMARGVPVIASRNAGTPDIVQNCRTGFLVEPGDVNAIAAALKELSADEELRSRLSANCVLEMQRFAWPRVLESVERELQRIARDGDAASGPKSD